MLVTGRVGGLEVRSVKAEDRRVGRQYSANMPRVARLLPAGYFPRVESAWPLAAVRSFSSLARQRAASPS